MQQASHGTRRKIQSMLGGDKPFPESVLGQWAMLAHDRLPKPPGSGSPARTRPCLRREIYCPYTNHLKCNYSYHGPTTEALSIAWHGLRTPWRTRWNPSAAPGQLERGLAHQARYAVRNHYLREASPRRDLNRDRSTDAGTNSHGQAPVPAERGPGWVESRAPIYLRGTTCTH